MDESTNLDLGWLICQSWLKSQPVIDQRLRLNRVMQRPHHAPKKIINAAVIFLRFGLISTLVIQLHLVEYK